jgi:hypothetical protein
LDHSPIAFAPRPADISEKSTNLGRLACATPHSSAAINKSWKPGDIERVDTGFLVFGIIGHYCGGARWPTGEQFLKNITLWYACPWTLSVASVQAGGLGMVALGLAQLTAVRLAPCHRDNTGFAALWLCVIGLVGVFLVGYPGYFVFDAIWPSFYYSPVAAAERTPGCCGKPSSLAFISRARC